MRCCDFENETLVELLKCEENVTTILNMVKNNGPQAQVCTCVLNSPIGRVCIGPNVLLNRIKEVLVETPPSLTPVILSWAENDDMRAVCF
jgi:hypothetical protein